MRSWGRPQGLLLGYSKKTSAKTSRKSSLLPLVIIIFIAKGKCIGEFCLSSLLFLMIAESRISK
jgi:hypothetical protein